MGEGFQVIIVTVVAAAACITLIRPYFRKAPRSNGAPPCANCAASAVRPPAAGRAGSTPASARSRNHS